MSQPASADQAAVPTAPGVGSIVPIGALVLAALAMATSPLFVRTAEVGPFASAFWRVGGALPVLWLWAVWEARRAGRPARAAFELTGAILVAGLVFAGDLLVWHIAILRTTVANATFFATMAPIWVVLGSWLLIGEKVGRGGVYGLLLCMAGVVAILGSSYSFAPHRLEGDIYGIVTSVFFGAYFLAIRVARRRAGTGRIIFLSSLISAPVLLVTALMTEGRLLPTSLGGVAAVAGLSYFSHAGGQGFLAYALGHLPAAFASLVTFLGSFVAAALAWLFFDESLSLTQVLGGALILTGIFAARPR
jgi:drug/metabolite transporter (DMT)-like permease